ncbi:MAG TPA: hypothetical protein DHU96_34850 [Actinobacteria bacterium]|nr:hypothetical protein [Actinomycetota bacterium]
MLATVQLQEINYDLAETIGWPRQIALAAREYHALPSASGPSPRSWPATTARPHPWVSHGRRA